MPDPLANLRVRYHEIVRSVTRALHTQLGDAERLGTHRRDILHFIDAAELVSACPCLKPPATDPLNQHRDGFPPTEFAILQSSADEMIKDLDDACHRSRDRADGPALVVATRRRTGKSGRPRLDIDPTFLHAALKLRGPAGLAPVFNCHARTVRRRALALGLVRPGQPLNHPPVQPEGVVGQERHPVAPIPTPIVDDAALDGIVSDALTVFPTFGRNMLMGHLRSQGHRIPRARVQASYMRIHGTAAEFGNRAIHRRAYKVSGANSLWHHDGQHGKCYLFLPPLSFI